MLELHLHIFGPVAAGAGMSDTIQRIDTGVTY
jgi:hypothetical protein